MFGSAIAGTGVGWIADHWGWTGVFVTMVVCCLLTIAFSAMTLGHRARERLQIVLGAEDNEQHARKHEITNRTQFGSGYRRESGIPIDAP